MLTILLTRQLQTYRKRLKFTFVLVVGNCILSLLNPQLISSLEVSLISCPRSKPTHLPQTMPELRVLTTEPPQVLGFHLVKVFYSHSLLDNQWLIVPNKKCIKRDPIDSIVYVCVDRLLPNLNLWARLAQVVSALGQRLKGLWFRPGLDSDHILRPITINWFTGDSIMWPAVPNTLRCLWA
jgi:hypothetical protein